MLVVWLVGAGVAIADSLFSTGFTFGSPLSTSTSASTCVTPSTPTSVSSLGPLAPPLMERGIAQLELMAKTFNNSSSQGTPEQVAATMPLPLTVPPKKAEKRRSECLYANITSNANANNGNKHRRWETSSATSVCSSASSMMMIQTKSEVTTRVSSCACKRPNSNNAAGNNASSIITTISKYFALLLASTISIFT